jgi:ketosteroid isomerase-like protein
MNGDRGESLLAKAEIVELINRYFAALDTKSFDAVVLAQIIADDGRIVRPNGAETRGPQAIGASHSTSFSRFRATQHMASSLIVTLAGDGEAAFRGNLVAMHLWAEGLGDPTVSPNDNYFLAGGVLTGKAALTTQGWRLTELANEVVWRRGTGFQQVLQTR